MKRAGKAKLPPHVLAAVEEKARLRRIDERAHFWSEVEAARTGVGGARSHGRCLPDVEEDLFPGCVAEGDASADERRAEIEAAYDDIPVKTVDPLGESLGGDGDASESESHFPTPPPFATGPNGVNALADALAATIGSSRTPMHSAAAEALRSTLTRRMGFTTLTPIQRHAIPLALNGRDLVCSAATGSGKTLAYLAPAVAIAYAAEAEDAEERSEERSSSRDDFHLDDEGREAFDDVPKTDEAKQTAGAEVRSGYGRRRAATADAEAEVTASFKSAEQTEGSVGAHLDVRSADETSASSSSSDPDRETPARPGVVVLVPTRELAAQVSLEARRLLFGTGRTVALLHGGQSVKPQLEQLAFSPFVVVSTPGRLLSCAADEGYVSLEDVKVLILDEADQMVDMGFAPQVAEICGGEACGMPPPAPFRKSASSGSVCRDFATKKNGGGRQTFLFSATFPPSVRRLALDIAVGGPSSGAPPPARVAVGRVGSTVAGIEQQVVLCPSHLREKKFPLLVDALVKTQERASADGSDRVLVFCAGKSTAAWVRDELTKLLDADALMSKARGQETPRTFAAEELHGDCSQGARSRALDAFKSGACRVLVATDVAARGLDLPDVSTVINFDLPTDGRDFDSYVHRIGQHRARGSFWFSALVVPPRVQQVRGKRTDLFTASRADARDEAGGSRVVRSVAGRVREPARVR
jgi:ATP-dependent RNA helicase DDX3X